MMNDELNTDLALSDVYDSLDRAELQMPQMVKEFMYALLRHAYTLGNADGVNAVYHELREAGVEL